MTRQSATDADAGSGSDGHDAGAQPGDGSGNDGAGSGGDGSGSGDGESGMDGAGSDGCAMLSADCAGALDVGTLIGTKRTSVTGFPDAKSELDYQGRGSGWVEVHIVDEFNAFGDLDFDNLVGVGATLVGQAGTKYRLTITGGATPLCGDPYDKHVVETNDSGVAELDSIFGRYMGMPPLNGSHVNDFGYMAIHVEQLEGDCNASFVLQLQGHPCASNCAYNTTNPCKQSTEPKVCAEVTD